MDSPQPKPAKPYQSWLADKVGQSKQWYLDDTIRLAELLSSVDFDQILRHKVKWLCSCIYRSVYVGDNDLKDLCRVFQDDDSVWPALHDALMEAGLEGFAEVVELVATTPFPKPKPKNAMAGMGSEPVEVTNGRAANRQLPELAQHRSTRAAEGS